jgi:hypothetical protein
MRGNPRRSQAENPLSSLFRFPEPALDDLTQTYLIVAEEFLTTLNRLGGGYTSEQAQQERNNVSGGWSEAQWLVTDVRELLIVTAESDNTDVIGKIAYLPFAIAKRALLAGDHYLFQQFLNFPSFIYSLGQGKGGQGKSFMVERSWRYLKELMDLYVQPRLMEAAPND